MVTCPEFFLVHLTNTFLTLLLLQSMYLHTCGGLYWRSSNKITSIFQGFSQLLSVMISSCSQRFRTDCYFQSVNNDTIECAGNPMVIDAEGRNGEPSSNSGLQCCIHFPTSGFMPWTRHKSSFSFTYGLNSKINCTPQPWMEKGESVLKTVEEAMGNRFTIFPKINDSSQTIMKKELGES